MRTFISLFFITLIALGPTTSVFASGGNPYRFAASIPEYNYYYPLSGTLLPHDAETPQDFGIVSSAWDARLLYLVYLELLGEPLVGDDLTTFRDYYTTSKSYETQYASYSEAMDGWNTARNEVVGITHRIYSRFPTARRHALGGLRPYSILRATEMLYNRESVFSEEELHAWLAQYDTVFTGPPNTPKESSRPTSSLSLPKITPNTFVSWRKKKAPPQMLVDFSLPHFLTKTPHVIRGQLFPAFLKKIKNVLIPTVQAKPKYDRQILSFCQEGIFAHVAQPENPSQTFLEDQLYQCASALFTNDQLAEAHGVYLHIAKQEKNPWSGDAAYMVGKIHAMNGDYDQATGWLALVESAEGNPLLAASARRLQGYVAYAVDPHQRIMDGLEDAFADPILANRLVALEDFASAWYAMYTHTNQRSRRASSQERELIELFEETFASGVGHDFFEWMYALHPGGLTPEQTYQEAEKHTWDKAWTFAVLLKDPGALSQQQRHYVLEKAASNNLEGHESLRTTTAYYQLLYQSYDPLLQNHVRSSARKHTQQARDDGKPIIEDYFRSLIARVSTTPQDLVFGMMRNGAHLPFQKLFQRLRMDFYPQKEEEYATNIPDSALLEALFWNIPHASLSEDLIQGAHELAYEESVVLASILVTRSVTLGDQHTAIRVFEALILDKIKKPSEDSNNYRTKNTYSLAQEAQKEWPALSDDERYAYAFLFFLGNYRAPVKDYYQAWSTRWWCPSPSAKPLATPIFMQPNPEHTRIAIDEETKNQASQGTLVALEQAIGIAEKIEATNPELAARVLSSAIRGTQYGSCNNNKKGRRAHQAFKKLHADFGNTPWAETTPYWYD